MHPATALHMRRNAFRRHLAGRWSNQVHAVTHLLGPEFEWQPKCVDANCSRCLRGPTDAGGLSGIFTSGNELDQTKIVVRMDELRIARHQFQRNRAKLVAAQFDRYAGELQRMKQAVEMLLQSPRMMPKGACLLRNRGPLDNAGIVDRQPRLRSRKHFAVQIDKWFTQVLCLSPLAAY